MARLKPPVLVTANSLEGGEVVYLTDQDEWGPLMHQGRVFNDLTVAHQALIDHGEEHRVVGPYLISIEVAGGKVRGHDYRENFRSRGPTNYWHGKQAENDDASL
ncbi:MAG: DUF2849 domain-containing protein [Pseudomonadales bacterium]